MNFLPLLGKRLEWVYRFAGLLAAVCMVALAGCVILSIVSRLLDAYVAGLTEISGYLMAATNCLALAYTFRAGEHIRITLFTDQMRRSTRARFECLTLAVASAIVIYLAYYMVRLAYFSWDYGDVSEGSISIKLWIPQSVAAVGCCLLALSSVHTFIEQCAKVFFCREFTTNTIETDKYPSSAEI